MRDNQFDRKREELRDQIRVLEHERERLGAFKGKEKKALKDQIRAIQNQVPTNADIEAEQAALEKEKKPVLDGYRAELEKLDIKAGEPMAKLGECLAELAKNR